MALQIPLNTLADGETTLCRDDGIDVLVCRVDGRYFAVAGRCPHAGQLLHGGRLKGHVLRCPLHRATFDVRDGRLLSAPAASGLATYPVLVDRGTVTIEVARPRPPPD